jgi:DDE superfamily endonuclease
VVKTYAPAGLTPVVYEWQSRDHLSVMGGLTPQGKMYSLVRQEALNGLHSVAFLGHLLRLAGERLLVIWDGSPIHRRAEVKEFLAGATRGKIHVEAIAPLRPGPQSGRRDVATPQARGDAQRSLPGPGRVAYGTSSGYRSLAAEKTSISVLLCWSQARVVKLYFFMQRSVT